MTSSVKYSSTKFCPVQHLSACKSISQVEAILGSKDLGILALIALTSQLDATQVHPNYPRHPPVVLVDTRVVAEASSSLEELSSSPSSMDLTLKMIFFIPLSVAFERDSFILLQALACLDLDLDLGGGIFER